MQGNAVAVAVRESVAVAVAVGADISKLVWAGVAESVGAGVLDTEEVLLAAGVGVSVFSGTDPAVGVPLGSSSWRGFSTPPFWPIFTRFNR
jgi:hypothetical protein